VDLRHQRLHLRHIARLLSGPMPWSSRTQKSATAGCLVIWRSITAS
jgi:hypothetical protein